MKQITIRLLAFSLLSLPATTAGAAPAPLAPPAAPSPIPAQTASSSPLATSASTATHPTERTPDTAASPTQMPQPTTDNYRFSGTLGPYPIGATLSVRPDQTVANAHYFYVKNLVDIPLSAQNSGEQMTLSEPGGGRFSLHFETSDKDAHAPLTFQTSTALAGTWTNGTKTYPVKLDLASIDHLAPNALYEDVTDAPPAVFEAMVQRFLRSVLSGNKAETAKLVSWPLRVNAEHAFTLKTPAALSTSWSRVFTPCVLNSLRGAIPHEMFVHNGQAMIANGTVWFDAHGARAINSCP
ncbi:hypothetical protein [Acetobacter cerevisiae]|uniref:hypothetical protein n=1 Tax=Acetobacter cerevisiae TaxID=178900 RepID=UPI0007826567|nr:hypothetical protein [Acetobacter cerevisiae]